MKDFLSSVSISSNLFSVSISEIFGLCLLVSFKEIFCGGVSGGFSVLSNVVFFGGRLSGFVVMEGCLELLVWVDLLFGLFFLGLQFRCYASVGSYLDLVQHGA